MESISYEINRPISVDDFIDLLERSTLAQRRPVHDRQCIEGMLANSNLWVTAHAGSLLVGVARSVTDFHYCCYLSDLAVDVAFQRQGIGKELMKRTQQQLGKLCNLILLSAPAAVEYYPHVGFAKHDQAWILRPGCEIQSR